MRIVGGDLGGRRIRAPRGALVRPTTDRVREALFSILGNIDGLVVLDLYAGTGALGVEALSRGASEATLVDTAIGTAARNVGDLDLRDRVRLVRADVLTFLRQDRSAYDLVFCDPPYKLAPRLGPDFDSLLDHRLRNGARVIAETGIETPMELSVPLLDERTYGSTMIRIHRKVEQ